MHRPIGVTILALLAGLAGLFEIWRTLVFLGVVKFTFIGKEVVVPGAAVGPGDLGLDPRRDLVLGGDGFWNVRAYAWSFGSFIAHLHGDLQLLRHPRSPTGATSPSSWRC